MRLTDAECAVLAQLLERVEVRHRRECPPEDTPIELSVATLVRAFALRFGANR